MPCGGFKDSTRTKYSKGGPVTGGPKGAAQISKVMADFKGGGHEAKEKRLLQQPGKLGDKLRGIEVREQAVMREMTRKGK